MTNFEKLKYEITQEQLADMVFCFKCPADEYCAILKEKDMDRWSCRTAFNEWCEKDVDEDAEEEHEA